MKGIVVQKYPMLPTETYNVIGAHSLSPFNNLIHSRIAYPVISSACFLTSSQVRL